MFKRLVIVLSVGFTAIAAAQTPAAVPATARPGHTCMKPDQPGRLATKNQLKTFDRDAKLFRECLQAFVKAQTELVKLHSDIGNSAVKEYNDYVTELSKKPDEEKK